MPAQVSRDDLIQFVDHLRTTVEGWDRAEPHVIVMYDPEVKRLSTNGPYENAEAAEAAIPALEADLNSPENNDGAPIAIFIAHLTPAR